MTGPQLTVTAARSAADLDGTAGIDASFTTSTIYKVERFPDGFRLVLQHLSRPVTKVYTWPGLAPHDGLLMARAGGTVIGFTEVVFDTWNGRARIEHLYVSARHRGVGAGRALLAAADARARTEPGMRCLWLETQNVNYPAIGFYRRAGFRLCGLDDTLYRPGDSGLLPGEVALYFVRDLPR
jgi:ribosomal protein S18 acetylase RimI-like enzyme